MKLCILLLTGKRLLVDFERRSAGIRVQLTVKLKVLGLSSEISILKTHLKLQKYALEMILGDIGGKMFQMMI